MPTVEEERVNEVAEEVVDTVNEESTSTDETVVAENDNNEIKNTEMGSDDKIEQIKEIISDADNTIKSSKRKVKVEKKEKGIIERTESSTILLTEDNKMLLND